jgi:pyruvate-ferredoxin/flavodoxin oxidoreductase
MKTIVTDTNEAVGSIAYKLSQVIPIYPITPSSPMSEYCSKLSSKGEKNLFGDDVKMIEMQSEAGVSGVLHGALLSRACSTTFTSSQGLLLMIPNMYKIAGENLPGVIHVAARAISSHALSIFCDHSDIMAARSTGFVMLGSSSVQEGYDMALAAHTLAMKASLPVLHFFDGFRTSHEIQKIDILEDEKIKDITKDYFENFKNSFEEKQYGTAQNPDVFFQNREKNEIKYRNVQNDIKDVFCSIEKATGRKYDIFEYYGNKDAEKVIIAMGSACQTIEEYIDNHKEEKIGLVKVRLYRPFYYDYFKQVLPKTAKTITAIDRTKENGSISPLALDVSYAIKDLNVKFLSGRYGLGGKEFSPACVKAIFDNMDSANPKDYFTCGIVDDVLGSSLEIKPYENKNEYFEIKVFGLGSDGSVSASKSTVKILGDKFENVQGYFEYDSKKSGSLTISHLRLANQKIKSEYLIENENIISINNFSFVTKYDCLKGLKQNGIVLINSIFDKDEIDRVLPKTYVQKLKETKSKLYLINAQKIANQNSLGSKINIIMQAALLKCANLLSDDEITKYLTKNIEKAFSAKGQDVVEKNINAMKIALENIEQVVVANLTGKDYNYSRNIDDEFYQNVMLPINQLDGNSIPVSKFSDDGSVPLDTSKYEKRNIALRLPNWIKENCIQCGQCVIACPHSALRAVLTDKALPDKESFVKAIGFDKEKFKILLSPEDCTGCGVCANTCPALKKAIAMTDASEILDEKKKEYELDKDIVNISQEKFAKFTPKGLQFEKSLFEFPGACAGCGETAYIKILTMLNGSNMVIANATGCSSIYGGSFGSCPYCKDENGGIFWASSLFEDNAEFGLGLKLGSHSDKKVWIIGGDGWAYDIGYGGLDHVLNQGEDVNILVLDNQTYSNTGGQESKATPTGATVKFAENGKKARKKDLGINALNLKDVFVGQISLGGNMAHAIKTLKEAQDYKGTSIVIAYAPCVNQGYDMAKNIPESKLAVESGFWPIYKYNPTDKKLVLSSGFNTEKYEKFLSSERRFVQTKENGKNELLEKQKNNALETFEYLKYLSEK